MVEFPAAASLEGDEAGVEVSMSVDSSSESLENNESWVEVSVSIESWLGRRSMPNGNLMRGLEGYDSGMRSP